MTNEENESANIKTSNPLTPQQDNRIFDCIPVRPAPWSNQSEAGSAMDRERALGMFRTANQWLYERIAEGATCDCGNCYLCAYKFLAAPSSPPPRELARTAADETIKYVGENISLLDASKMDVEKIAAIILRTCFSEK